METEDKVIYKMCEECYDRGTSECPLDKYACTKVMRTVKEYRERNRGWRSLDNG